MRRSIYMWFLVVVFVFCFSALANAGILDSFDNWQEFLNNLDLTAGEMYDVGDNEWQSCFTVSLYDFKLADKPVISIDTGYVVDHTILADVRVNLTNLGIMGSGFSIGPLKPEIGFGLGWDLDDTNVTYGPILVGLKARF